MALLPISLARFLGQESRHVQPRFHPADPHQPEQLPEGPLQEGPERNHGDAQEVADVGGAIQEVSGRADEDAERLPAVLRPLHQAQRVQEARCECQI